MEGYYKIVAAVIGRVSDSEYKIIRSSWKEGKTTGECIAIIEAARR